ncbi:hypothetical protein OJAV_G00175400 [Oryzias javanicus]|uniref:Uncharacterized protein n=1 Tax=Oryzias javanicus TaxID=123683 RepID=A0A437CGA9_ORYJA|nr:hypothetical protein OJAV_G00175400 [Oryzias javanicus]
MTLRIRLSPGRVHQKHHRLQCSLSIVSLSPAGCHPHRARVRSRQRSEQQRKPSPGTPHFAPASQLLRRRKEVKIDAVT